MGRPPVAIQSGQNYHTGTLLGAAILMLLAAQIASGLIVAHFSLALPAGPDDNFQTNTTEDNFDELRQRARGALRTLIEKQQANERQRSVVATERVL